MSSNISYSSDGRVRRKCREHATVTAEMSRGPGVNHRSIVHWTGHESVTHTHVYKGTMCTVLNVTLVAADTREVATEGAVSFRNKIVLEHRWASHKRSGTQLCFRDFVSVSFFVFEEEPIVSAS